VVRSLYSHGAAIGVQAWLEMDLRYRAMAPSSRRLRRSWATAGGECGGLLTSGPQSFRSAASYPRALSVHPPSGSRANELDGPRPVRDPREGADARDDLPPLPWTPQQARVCARSVRWRRPNHRIAVMGGKQLAGVLDIIQRQSAEKKGVPVDEERLGVIKQMIEGQIDNESSAFFATARLWDDGRASPHEPPISR
jgi:hypothetical protein